MTTGGTVVRERLEEASLGHFRARLRTLSSHPQIMNQLPTAIAIAVFIGCFMRIRQRWFLPGYDSFGYTTRAVAATVDGTAIAPDQYRPLMPWVDTLVAGIIDVPLPTGILVSDAILMTVMVVLLHRLSIRLGAPWLIVGGAAAWAWMLVKLDWWHAEQPLLAVVVTATALLLLDRNPRCWVLFVLGFLACLARSDFAVGLGLILIWVGVRRRTFPLVVTGGSIIATAATATIILINVYPDAHYLIDVVQLPYNLLPSTLFLDLLFYGPLLLTPALLALRTQTQPILGSTLMWFGLTFAMVMVVGHTDESRIFIPFAPVLGVAAASALRELVRLDESASSRLDDVEPLSYRRLI